MTTFTTRNEEQFFRDILNPDFMVLDAEENIAFEEAFCFDLFNPNQVELTYMRKYELDLDPFQRSYPNFEVILRDAPTVTVRDWFLDILISEASIRVNHLKRSVFSQKTYSLSASQKWNYQDLPLLYNSGEVAKRLPEFTDDEKTHPIYIQIFSRKAA